MSSTPLIPNLTPSLIPDLLFASEDTPIDSPKIHYVASYDVDGAILPVGCSHWETSPEPLFMHSQGLLSHTFLAMRLLPTLIQKLSFL